MPYSSTTPVKDLTPASSLASRWSSMAASPWSRLLALQILQVTSLSITFSLAYDFSIPALSPAAPGSASVLQPAVTRLDGALPAGSSSPGSGTKSTRGRKKKGTASSSKASSSQQRHLQQQHQSDTEFEDADDSETGGAAVAAAASAAAGHVHYPLYQRGSELVGSGPMDLGESSTGGGGNGRPHFATLLSKGLAVTVNGSPWRSVAAHVIEGEDEAVVVIYGLSPGRDYVVELGLVGDEEGRFAELSIATSTSSRPEPVTAMQTVGSPTSNTAHSSAMNTSNSAVRSRSRANSLRSRSRANSASSGSQAAAVQPSITSVAPPPAFTTPHPLSLPPAASPPPSVSPGQDVDAIAALLKHQLAQSQAQHAHLTSELKSHRRTSQKSEAALRANITALQKAAEKNSVGDLRARQKALALGESVKRLIGGKEDVDLERERLAAEVSGDGPEGEGGLEALEKQRQSEWETLRGEAKDVSDNRDEIVTANEKMIGDWETELSALLTKLEKLNTKHDRLTTQITTFNERLESIAKEKAEIASGTHPALRDAALSFNAHSQMAGGAGGGGGGGRGDFGHARGRPPPMSRGGGTNGGGGHSASQSGGRGWKGGPPPPAARGQPNTPYPSPDGGTHAQPPGSSSTSPLQISAAPFRPHHAHGGPGPHQYHRSSPSFTVQIPATQAPHPAAAAQSSFMAAAAAAQADPYSPVFATDKDEPAPHEPAAFPPLPSQSSRDGSVGSGVGEPPSLSHNPSAATATPGSYSLAAVAAKSSLSHHLPTGRPSYASFSSASPQSSPALAHSQVRQHHHPQQQPSPHADGFPPLSPVGSLHTPSRQGSAGSLGKASGTPDASERAAQIPLPMSPTVDP